MYCRCKCKFCPYIKGKYPWNKVEKQHFFCLYQLIVLLQTDLEEIFQLSKMVRKRGEKTFI